MKFAKYTRDALALDGKGFFSAWFVVVSEGGRGRLGIALENHVCCPVLEKHTRSEGQ